MNTNTCQETNLLSENISVVQLPSTDIDLNQNVSATPSSSYSISTDQSELQLKQNQNIAYGDEIDNSKSSNDLAKCGMAKNLLEPIKHEGSHHMNMEYGQNNEHHSSNEMSFNNIGNSVVHLDNHNINNINNNNNNNSYNDNVNNINNNNNNNIINNNINNNGDSMNGNNHLTNANNNILTNNNSINVNNNNNDAHANAISSIKNVNESSNSYRNNVISIIDNICSSRGMEITLNSFSAQELKSLASVLNTHLQLAANKKETTADSPDDMIQQQQQQPPNSNQRQSPYTIMSQPKKPSKSITPDKANMDKPIDDYQVNNLNMIPSFICVRQHEIKYAEMLVFFSFSFSFKSFCFWINFLSHHFFFFVLVWLFIC